MIAIGLFVIAVGATTVVNGAPQASPRADSPPAPAAVLPSPAGTTERVSVGTDGRQAGAGSGGVSDLIESMNANQVISGDGRWVAFTSAATDLIAGQPLPAGGLFLRDRQSGAIAAVPWVGAVVFPAGLVAAEPTISADGAVVAFTVIATTRGAASVASLAGMTPYVFAWDRGTNVTELISMDANGRAVAGYQPSISGDGRHVAYTRWFADTTPPVLANLTTDGFPSGNQWFIFGPSAPCTPHLATITVTATDPDDPVTGVTLFVQPNGGGVLSQEMSSAGGDLWRGTITALDPWQTGPITYWVQARDSNGNESQPFFPGAGAGLSKGDCIL